MSAVPVPRNQTGGSLHSQGHVVQHREFSGQAGLQSKTLTKRTTKFHKTRHHYPNKNKTKVKIELNSGGLFKERQETCLTIKCLRSNIFKLTKNCCMRTGLKPQ